MAAGREARQYSLYQFARFFAAGAFSRTRRRVGCARNRRALGGSVEMIPNPVAVAELAVEKGATTLLMPISARRQLFELPDALATKVSIEFFADPKDAFLKALVE